MHPLTTLNTFTLYSSLIEILGKRAFKPYSVITRLVFIPSVAFFFLVMVKIKLKKFKLCIKDGGYSLYLNLT